MALLSNKDNIVKENIIHINAAGRPIGRTASEAAHILLGKHLPDFEKHKISPTRVIIENVEKAVFTGKKVYQKNYYRHSGRLGRLKTTPLGKLYAVNPHKVMKLAIKGMLPRNRLLKLRLAKLSILRSAK